MFDHHAVHHQGNRRHRLPAAALALIPDAQAARSRPAATTASPIRRASPSRRAPVDAPGGAPVAGAPGGRGPACGPVNDMSGVPMAFPAQWFLRASSRSCRRFRRAAGSGWGAAGSGWGSAGSGWGSAGSGWGSAGSGRRSPVPVGGGAPGGCPRWLPPRAPFLALPAFRSPTCRALAVRAVDVGPPRPGRR